MSKLTMRVKIHEHFRDINVDTLAFSVSVANSENQAEFLNSLQHQLRTQCQDYAKEDMQLCYIARDLHPKTVDLLKRLVAFAEFKEQEPSK